MKTALVTGSSRGIGRAIAMRLAKDGYKVIIHGASASKKAEEARDAIIANGGQAEVMIANLCDIKEVKALGEKIKDVDVLVLNASLQYRTPWQEITTEACFEQLTCNFVASMHLIQAVADSMKAKKWGRVITIGSVQEAKPHPDMLVYSASKAAQTNMVESLSLQLARTELQ